MASAEGVFIRADEHRMSRKCERADPEAREAKEISSDRYTQRIGQLKREDMKKFVIASAFAIIAATAVTAVSANNAHRAYDVVRFSVGGMANIPRPTCASGYKPYLLVTTGSPGPSWPVQVQIRGNGPWTVSLFDGKGMEDMTTTANVDVMCIPKS